MAWGFLGYLIDKIKPGLDAKPSTPVVPIDNKKMKGIDVSRHQGKINWFQVSSEFKPDFVFIKATEGVGFVDPTVKVNAEQAKQNNLKISYYHYATLNVKNETADAVSEAKHFIDTLKTLPTPDFSLALDLEENKVQLSPKQVLIWINSFLSEMAKAGYSNLYLYSYSPFLVVNLPKNHGLKNKLWLAGYVPKEKLKIPHGWDSYDIWQYSATGKVPGISTNVDMNISEKSVY